MCVPAGASSDLKQATSIASHMVREWGMSEKVGLRTLEPRAAADQLGPYTNELVSRTTLHYTTNSVTHPHSYLEC